MLFYLRYILRLAKYVSFPKVLNFLKMYYSYFASRFFKYISINYLPPFIALEPTNVCNLSCPECPTGAKILTRKKGNASFSDFKGVIDELSSSLFVITVYFQGEPLLSKGFFEIVEYAHLKKIYTYTSTNAQFLDAKNAQKLVDSGIDKVIVSVDGYDQESYEQYRVGGQYKKVIDGIRLLKEERQRQNASGPLIVAQCLELKTTELHKKKIEQQVRAAGADTVSFKSAQFYDEKNIEQLFPVFARSRYSIKNGKPLINGELPNHCKRLWSSPVVTWNGELVPCCFDKNADHQFGNVVVGGFKNGWASQQAKEFRRNLLLNRKKIEICRNCSEGL